MVFLTVIIFFDWLLHIFQNSENFAKIYKKIFFLVFETIVDVFLTFDSRNILVDKKFQKLSAVKIFFVDFKFQKSIVEISKKSTFEIVDE